MNVIKLAITVDGCTKPTTPTTNTQTTNSGAPGSSSTSFPVTSTSSKTSISTTPSANICASKNNYACEKDQVYLSCDAGEIVIQNANYGRTSPDVCTNGPIKNTSCYFDATATLVNKYINIIFKLFNKN